MSEFDPTVIEQESASDDGQAIVVGIALTALGTLFYAFEYVLCERLFTQYKQPVDSKQLCLYTGMWGMLFTLVWMCVYTFPNWERIVTQEVRDAGGRGRAESETRIADGGDRARKGKSTPDDRAGGAGTSAKGGGYGSLMSTPILNPPQSGILGMHKIEKRPVVVDDAIVIRPMMYLALSYDHRIIDGREAVSFLARIKELVEDPRRIVLGV